MLNQRLQTACLLLVTLLATLFGLPIPFFSILIVFFTLAAAFEWATLSGCQTLSTRLLYTGLTGIILLFSYKTFHQSFFLGAGIAWWFFSIILLFSYPTYSATWNNRIIQLILGWFILIPACIALFYIEKYKNYQTLMIYFLGVVSMTDIGGYVFGKLLGKHTFAPAISPKKTWEGLIGSVFFVLSYTIIIAWFFHYTYTETALLIMCSLLISLFAVLGDLVESMFKRAKGIKDSGTWVPGHGGVLDRMDSLTAAAPIFWLILPVISFMSG